MKNTVRLCLVLPVTPRKQVSYRHSSSTAHALCCLHRRREAKQLMATGHEDRDQLCADESVGSRNKRARPCVPAMWSVWSSRELATTHSARTGLVRRPYRRSGKMTTGHETWRSGVIWRATQSAPRGCGLHAGGARDDCGPVGPCRERAGARGTTAAPCRDRARAVRGA